MFIKIIVYCTCLHGHNSTCMLNNSMGLLQAKRNMYMTGFYTVVILFVSSMTNMLVHVSHTYYKVVWSLLAMGAHYK